MYVLSQPINWCIIVGWTPYYRSTFFNISVFSAFLVWVHDENIVQRINALMLHIIFNDVLESWFTTQNDELEGRDNDIPIEIDVISHRIINDHIFVIFRCPSWTISYVFETISSISRLHRSVYLVNTASAHWIIPILLDTVKFATSCHYHYRLRELRIIQW